MTAMYPKTDLDEIKRTITLLHLPGDVTELRAIRKNGYIEAGYFDDFDKMAKEAYRLSESGQMVAVYLVPNEGDKALLSRAANRMYTANDGKKDTTADKDIIKINWVLIDADAKRPAGISSTDAQHEAAIKMIYDIRDYLIGLGFNSNSIIVADSANGGHILVRVGLKPTTENKALIKSCIAALKARFETRIVGIDESVVNPSRVWKIYGTISKKGDFTDERPHRKAHLLEVPENIVIERIESLQTLAATEPQPEVTAPKTTYQSKGDHPAFDIETWMSAHGIEVTKKEPYNGGTKYIIRSCPFDSNHNGTSAAMFKMSNGAIVYKCQHASCSDNDWHKLREMLEPEYADRKRQYEQHEYKQTYPRTKHHHLNDVGNAERLIDKYGNKIRYNYERKLWLIWNGKFWKWDDGSEIMRLAQKTARSIYGEITAEDDEDTAKTKAKWASQSESNQRLCAMIAQTEPLASITLDQLDRDEWLLNANNGTINLKTGKLQPHNPTDLITRVIDTDFVPDATSDQWVKFLNRIFDNKADLVAYIQRAMGYSITGNQGEQAIFFCHGSGWNGKSTLLGVIRKILMAYSSEVEPAAFMVDKNRGGGPNEAIASLYKVNFVSSTEIEDGQKLSTSLLKRMTGGESLRCERKFEHGFNFRPQYKLWLCGNHEPEISDTTNSIWNRLKKIPFIVKISAEERVKDYDTKLVADHGAAILAWLVRGCLEWQRIGLGESSAVKEATQAYRDSQDALHDFLTECCFIKSGETLLITILHKAYIEWSESNGDKYYLGKKKFNDRMEEKGFVKVSGHGNKTVWRGLRLLTEDEKVNLVKMDNQNTQSSYHDDNSLKVSEKQITFLTNLTPTEAKAPKRLETLEENCPFCGSANIGVWPDATPGYYCLDCYPDFYVPAVEIQNDDSHK